MAYRAAGGRPIKVAKNPKTVRALMRRHLREEKKNIKDLVVPWKVYPTTVYTYFYKNAKPLPPQLVDAFIEFLKLDEFDAMELRWLGAIEMGWQLDNRYVPGGNNA